MAPTDSEILTELRIAVARLEEQVRMANHKLDTAVITSEHLEKRLAPFTANMNRWKGALAVITLVAGSLGATVTTIVKQFLGVSSP